MRHVSWRPTRQSRRREDGTKIREGQKAEVEDRTESTTST